jgi:hypothetical protein
MIIPNPKVYQAARIFAQHEPDDTVKDLLSRCPDLDDNDVNKILQAAKIHIEDVDGGYSAFLNAVNLVLHTKAYNLEITSRKDIKTAGKILSGLKAGHQNGVHLL